ncbi:hypothetical protein [Pedobacter sp.]
MKRHNETEVIAVHWRGFEGTAKVFDKGGERHKNNNPNTQKG